MQALKRYPSCEVERTFRVKLGTLSLATGETREHGSETRTGPCAVPLFGELQSAGVCASCAKRWSVPDNLPTPKGSERVEAVLAALEALEAKLGADPAERSEQYFGWRLDNARTFGGRLAATDASVRAELERFYRVLAQEPEPAPVKPSRAQLSALRKLEDALGWKARKLSAPATLEDFRERSKTARDSAGLGLLIAPDFQARAIRKGLEALKLASPARR